MSLSQLGEESQSWRRLLRVFGDRDSVGEARALTFPEQQSALMSKKGERSVGVAFALGMETEWAPALLIIMRGNVLDRYRRMDRRLRHSLPDRPRLRWRGAVGGFPLAGRNVPRPTTSTNRRAAMT